MYDIQDKMVSHPPHYQSETGMEVIDVIEAFTFNLKGIEATDTGNIIKYICRWKEKNGVQDLKKAMWYLEHLIKHVEKMEEENREFPYSGKIVYRDDGPDVRMDKIYKCGYYPYDSNSVWYLTSCRVTCPRYKNCEHAGIAEDLLRCYKKSTKEND